MSGTAKDWDARVDRLLPLLPGRLRKGDAWVRDPSRRIVRIAAALLLIAGSFLAILPVFGLWMLPLGLALLSDDIPALKIPLERSAGFLERVWARLFRRK
jgi:hypothetical protein